MLGPIQWESHISPRLTADYSWSGVMAAISWVQKMRNVRRICPCECAHLIIGSAAGYSET